MFYHTDFKPSGTPLKFWTLLPQVSSRADNPPLFGKIKSISIYYIMVIILIGLEIMLALNLNEEGIDFKVFVALSIADFALVILPALAYLNPAFNPALIKANIFIQKTKLLLVDITKIPTQFGDNKEAYRQSIINESNRFKSQKTKTFIYEVIISILIVGLSLFKFYSFYSVLGSDIFVEPVGRFICITILISILVHLLCTKYVFYHLFYYFSMNSQKNAFQHQGLYKVRANDRNRILPLNYLTPYDPVVVENQRICQEVSEEAESKDTRTKTIQIESSGVERTYRIDKIQGNEKVCLIYTGLLLDSEITEMSMNQADDSAKLAVFASGKEIQISQLTALN